MMMSSPQRQLLEEAQDGLGTSKILFLATLNYFIDIYNDIHIFFFFLSATHPNLAGARDITLTIHDYIRGLVPDCRYLTYNAHNHE